MRTFICLIARRCHKHNFCRDKHAFVETKHVFCRDKQFCCDKSFVATSILLSRQTTSFVFVATKKEERRKEKKRKKRRKKILVADHANDIYVSTAEPNSARFLFLRCRKSNTRMPQRDTPAPPGDFLSSFVLKTRPKRICKRNREKVVQLAA